MSFNNAGTINIPANIVTDSKPEKLVLLKCLSSISSKWYEIGDLLGVDENILEGLLATNLSDQIKLSKTLRSWLNNHPTPTTWRNIIKIIEEPLQNKSLATNIRRYLVQGGIFILCFSVIMWSVLCQCILHVLFDNSLHSMWQTVFKLLEDLCN